MRFVLFLTVLLLPAAAHSHVTANPNAATAGTYFETKFRVSHGCEGSDTVEVHIRLPKGFTTVKPQAKAGWTVETKKSKLDKPVDAGHGKMAHEQFDEIIWKGGLLADDQYDEFGLLVKLPEEPGILWFPVKQVCVQGEADWKNIPSSVEAWGGTDHPAPYVTTTPSASSAHHH